MASCSSSVSVPVQSTNSDDHRSKSCDSVCITNSSCVLKKRKPKNLQMYSNRNYPKLTPASNTVKQRVLSAKLLKLRSLQSQLNDANYHLSELSKENEILKNLQRRQDKALSKYENVNEDLPRLLRGHEEQIRMLTEKNKAQRYKIRELTELVKNRDEELLRNQERLAHLDRLSKDRRLVDKEKLLDQIEDLKLKLLKVEEYNSILNRKLDLESKTAKQKINNENMKYRTSQRELTQARAVIERLTGLLETKEKVHPRKNRFSRLQTVSMVNLSGCSQKPKNVEELATIEENTESIKEKTSFSNIKLEPIKSRPPDESFKKQNRILDSPSENIKNRLSSSSSKSRESREDSNLSVEDDNNYGKLSDNGSESSLNNFLLYEANIQGDPPVDEENLEQLNAQLDAAIKKAEENVDSEFEKKIGTVCANSVHDVREFSERVDAQKESLKVSKNDINSIIETFEKTQKLEKKLNKSFLNFDPLDDEFLKSFRLEDKMIKNGNVTKEPKFGSVDKKKLLDQLKAIDDADNLDFDDLPMDNKNFSREIER